MPTQEERLAAVEQDLARFKTETIDRYQNFAMQFTITKALAENTIGRLAMMHEEMTQRLNGQTTRLNSIETQLNEHTTHLNRLETKIDTIQTTLTQILAHLPERP